jgi:hypothetical protein
VGRNGSGNLDFWAHFCASGEFSTYYSTAVLGTRISGSERLQRRGVRTSCTLQSAGGACKPIEIYDSKRVVKGETSAKAARTGLASAPMSENIGF